jgi:hypothetical protein
MKRVPLRPLVLTGAAVALAGALGTAQIVRLDLRQMIARTDNAIVGKITKQHVIRIDHPIDGPELYYTHLTIEGRSLVNGEVLTAVVTFPGGWIDENQGADNSEAPSADEIQIGNEVVAFYKWSENMGGDLAANALYASHGGIYRVASGNKGKIVLGKGDGYAVSSNVALTTLDTNIARIHEELRQNGGK